MSNLCKFTIASSQCGGEIGQIEFEARSSCLQPLALFFNEINGEIAFWPTNLRGLPYMTSAKMTTSPLVTYINQLILFPKSAFWGPPPPLECGRHIWKPPNHKRGFPAGGHHRPHLSLSSLSHLLSSSAAVVPTNRVNFHNYWFCRRVSQSMKACILLTLLPTFSDRFDAISVFLIKLTQQRLILSKHN